MPEQERESGEELAGRREHVGGEDKPVLQIASDDELLFYELHSYDDHDEVVIFDEGEREGESVDGERFVVLASSLEELDEAIEILQEIRESLVECAKKRGGL
jgi:hypothetical protein